MKNTIVVGRCFMCTRGVSSFTFTTKQMHTSLTKRRGTCAFVRRPLTRESSSRILQNEVAQVFVGRDVTDPTGDERAINQDGFARVISCVKRNFFDHTLDDRLKSSRPDISVLALTCVANCAISRSPSSPNWRSTPSVPSNAWYCFVRAFCGTVKIM